MASVEGIQVIGLHPLESAKDCYLIELEIFASSEFDWEKVTQERFGLAHEDWQVAYDERQIGSNRWALFMHELDLDQPILTSVGPLKLPPVTPIPRHLSEIVYEPPC